MLQVTTLSRFKKAFGKIWKDPVWSKVIAGVLAAGVTVIYNGFNALRNNTSFKIEFYNFWITKIEIWKLCIFIGLLVAFVLLLKRKGTNTSILFQYDDDLIELDRDLFTKIRTHLPSDKMAWIKSHGYSSSPFKGEYMLLLDIIDEEEKADFEFLHPKMERLKQELIVSFRELREALSSNIFGAGHSWLAIPREWDFERFEQARNAITPHEIAVGLAYDKFIKTGRRLLKVI